MRREKRERWRAILKPWRWTPRRVPSKWSLTPVSPYSRWRRADLHCDAMCDLCTVTFVSKLFCWCQDEAELDLTVSDADLTGCLMQHCDYLCCKVVCWYGTERLSTAGVPSCVESVYQERFNPLLDGLTPLSKLMRFWCRATNKNALRKRLSWNHVVLKVLFLNKREMTSTFVLIPKETVLFILHSNKYM